MFKGFLSCLTIWLVALPTAMAGDLPAEYQAVSDMFEKTFPQQKVTSVKSTPIDGLLLVAVGAEIFYVSTDGKYLLAGDLYGMESRENLTEAVRDSARAEYVMKIDPARSILFAAEDPKYTVTVFTDIDCGYCRKLHREIDDYNALGISVRYLFFPRSGPGTESWAKAEAVWCADSPQDAMTAAKNNKPFETEECDDTPVAEHYALVQQLGLRGTPAIFTASGRLISGYVPADEMLEILEEST
jgi:thiol:disulfide interchange protein DsbC